MAAWQIDRAAHRTGDVEQVIAGIECADAAGGGARFLDHDGHRAGSAVASQDLKAAVDAVVAGQEVRLKETKAFGCTIKRVAAQ